MKLKNDWLKECYGDPVERRDIPRPGNKALYPVDHTQIGVLHTTEGLHVEGDFRQLAMTHDSPTFLVGDGKIIQCRPLSAQAAALRPGGNQFAAVQIEVTMKSSDKVVVRPDMHTFEALAKVLAYCAGNGVDIPLIRAVPTWRDDLSDFPRGSQLYGLDSFRRASASKNHWWPKRTGWWMHLEVPGNLHWDCGKFDWTALIARAKDIFEGRIDA